MTNIALKSITLALLVITLIPLISGCTSLFGSAKKEETKITATQGVGVLEFKPVTTTMLASTSTPTYNYVLLSVRNNAEGNKAKNIKVSLENVEPFIIYEGGAPHDPSEIRDISSQFFNDYNQPYRVHKIDNMQPDEEIQFFWNIQAPSAQKIAGMVYQHSVYYTLVYDYTSTMTQTIAGISQDEYLRQSKEGPVTLSGQTLTSPGEIKLNSKTQQPILYSEATGNISFTLQFEVTNTGEGVPKPGTDIIIAIKPSDAFVRIDAAKATEQGWSPYTSTSLNLGVNVELGGSAYCPYAIKTTAESQAFCECLFITPKTTLCSDMSSTEITNKLTAYQTNLKKAQSLSIIFDDKFSTIDFEELDATRRSQLWLFKLTSEQLSSGKYSLLLPVFFDTTNIFEPQKILTFNAYVAYTYLKEGSTSISVYPVEQQ